MFPTIVMISRCAQVLVRLQGCVCHAVRCVLDLPVLRLSLAYNHVRRLAERGDRQEHGRHGVSHLRVSVRHRLRLLLGAAAYHPRLHGTCAGLWDYSLRLLCVSDRWFHFVVEVISRVVVNCNAYNLKEINFEVTYLCRNENFYQSFYQIFM